MADLANPIPTEPATEAPAGYVLDFITGEKVRATAEEIEAVQIFAKRLVEDFGYPKAVITTRPQFRVRPRPSSENKSGYPVDIAVFSSERKLEDDAYMLVECKRKTRKDGEKQLKLYLTMSDAAIGVWFNGKDHLYILKQYRRGAIEWVTLPTLPKWGQSVSDIGLLTRGQLSVPTNLKTVFKDIRNHLAGNTTGITRDQALAQEMMNVLFCKIYDELDTAPDDLPEFRVGVDEKPQRMVDRIRTIFKAVKAEYPDVFSGSESISLDKDSLRYVVGELQNFLITGATRDAIGEAFEVFIGPAVRGEEGQFFTPRNVVQMMIELLDPEPGETLIDPACGSGGFLVVALEKIWAKVEDEARKKKWTAAQLERRRREIAMRCIRGGDKDSFLTKVTKAYMAIIGDGRGGVFCEDMLAEPDVWREDAQDGMKMGKFDIVVTNPPFGSKIKVTGAHKLSQYELAKQWKSPRRSGGEWEDTGEYRKEQAPQIIFIERCIQFLKPGVDRGLLSVETGVEVGKMAYGTGTIPFIRTSDIADWEVKTVRHGVSEEIYREYEHAAALKGGDILLVRDGTYLVGSSALVTEDDLPALICGGLYRIRAIGTGISPFTLLAYLNMPIVRKQMRARQFTRDVIDTLGYRVLEVKIPSLVTREAERLAAMVGDVMARKAEVKRNIGSIIKSLEPPIPNVSMGRPGWSMR